MYRTSCLVYNTLADECEIFTLISCTCSIFLLLQLYISSVIASRIDIDMKYKECSYSDSLRPETEPREAHITRLISFLLVLVNCEHIIESA